MGTNVHLTPELERFAQNCVASGRFNNVSEVVRSGLRLLQDAEERRAAFVASLEAAVAEGDRDGFLTADDVETDVRAAIDAVRTRSA
jgi:antitoxin ParD1/3/4